MALANTRFSERRRALAAKFAAQRIDSILITHLVHVRYLSGFTGSNAALLLNKDLSACICTDGRYTTQIAEEVPDIECILGRDAAETLLKRVDKPHRVAFEANFVTVAESEKLHKACGADVTLVPITGLVEGIRLHKDPLELERLREVAALASQALTDLLAAGELAVGRSEKAVAADLEYRMRKLGAERTSFDTIVASGPNSAKPHHQAEDRIIAAGDLVTIDFGAHLLGFNSDMTRTFIMEHTTKFTKEIYDIVLQAQLAGIEAATPGTKLVDVDRACRDIIKDAGYGEYFVHSTGHGVGLDLHETPFASSLAAEDAVLEDGMTLTIEPGIYVPDKGGVRIEDTLIITAGAPENITHQVSKDLWVV